MRYRQLGRTSVKLSELCLGTMTFGEQNSEAEGHAQMDCAVDCGINIFDAAEIYPVPPKPDTQGRTESIIGTWLARQKKRDKVLVATKIAGRGTADWLRKNRSLPRQSPAQIREAVEASLKRLRTDYIDLYQLHWPDRPMHVFQGLEYVHLEGDAHPIPGILGTLAELMQEGKVRFIGLSNETPWGLMTFLKAADEPGLPRIASIQNAYNLVNRTFEIGLSEIAQREGVSLLGYSPSARATSRANMKAARCRRARARHCSTVSGVMRRETDPRRFRPMSRLRASTASTRRRWQSLLPCRARL
jgi:aryl-alcohol dehydrogenase-like predicted oxidoreductase